MKKIAFYILTTILVSFSLSNSILSAEIGTCEWIVEQFFVNSSFQDKKDYIAKEEFERIFNNPTLGEMLKEAIASGFIELSYRQLMQDDTSAVFSITMKSEKLTNDMYCHFHNKEGRWKIHAIRELALTGIIFAMIQTLDSLPSIPDSLLFDYENAKLIVDSDSSLIDHFKKNQIIFKEIVDIYLKDSSISHTSIKVLNTVLMDYATDNEKRVLEILNKIYIPDVSKSDREISFTIGGMVDNVVLYLYIPADHKPPQMSPSDYIYVEKITENWYLVKKT